jgi:hypothetical protein
MIHNGWDSVDFDGADEEAQRWVEADLDRIARQREASLRAVADADADEARCLQALEPITRRVAEQFRQVEQRHRQVRSCRIHEVVVRLHQPAPACVSVALRWGAKLGLTDAERQLMRSYQRRPRRLFRYPAVVVAHEYHELTAVLDGAAQTLRLGSGPAQPLAQLLACHAIVERYLADGIVRPPLVASYHHRSEGYRERPG